MDHDFDRLGDTVEVRVDQLPLPRIQRGTGYELVQLVAAGVFQIVDDADLVDVAAIDEDDLRGYHDLGRPYIEVLDQLPDYHEVLLEIGDDQRVRRLVRDHLSAVGARALQRSSPGSYS